MSILSVFAVGRVHRPAQRLAGRGRSAFRPACLSVPVSGPPLERAFMIVSSFGRSLSQTAHDHELRAGVAGKRLRKVPVHVPPVTPAPMPAPAAPLGAGASSPSLSAGRFHDHGQFRPDGSLFLHDLGVVKVSKWPRSRDGALNWPDGWGIYQGPLFRVEGQPLNRRAGSTRPARAARGQPMAE
jgi:hypothetical protein